MCTVIFAHTPYHGMTMKHIMPRRPLTLPTIHHHNVYSAQTKRYAKKALFHEKQRS